MIKFDSLSWEGNPENGAKACRWRAEKMAEVGIFGAFFFASFGFAELANILNSTSDWLLAYLLGSLGQAKEMKIII